MTDRELMQMALNALIGAEIHDPEAVQKEIKALRERLEKDEVSDLVDELIGDWPVVPCKTHPDAPHGFDRNASHSEDRYVCECENWEPLAPAWVGLTDEEILNLAKAASLYGSDNHYEVIELAASIESKLKERNT